MNGQEKFDLFIPQLIDPDQYLEASFGLYADPSLRLAGLDLLHAHMIRRQHQLAVELGRRGVDPGRARSIVRRLARGEERAEIQSTLLEADLELRGLKLAHLGACVRQLAFDFRVGWERLHEREVAHVGTLLHALGGTLLEHLTASLAERLALSSGPAELRQLSRREIYDAVVARATPDRRAYRLAQLELASRLYGVAFDQPPRLP